MRAVGHDIDGLIRWVPNAITSVCTTGRHAYINYFELKTTAAKVLVELYDVLSGSGWRLFLQPRTPPPSPKYIY